MIRDRGALVHADLSVRSPHGDGRIVGSGHRVEVSLGWRLLLSLLLDRRLRRGSLKSWSLLERAGVGVRVRLPWFPALDLDRVSLMLSLGITWSLALLVPFLLT